MDSIPVAILIRIALPLGMFLIVEIGVSIFYSCYKEEGCLEERNSNPELNTADIDLHKMRLSKFQKSKYLFKNIFYG